MLKKGQAVTAPELLNHLRKKKAIPDQAFYVDKGGKNCLLVYAIENEGEQELMQVKVTADHPVLATAVSGPNTDLHPYTIERLGLAEPAFKIAKGAVFEIRQPFKIEGGQEGQVGDRLLCTKGGKKPEFFIPMGANPTIKCGMVLTLDPTLVKPSEPLIESELASLKVTDKSWQTWDGDGFEVKISGSPLSNPIILVDHGTGGPCDVHGDHSDMQLLADLAAGTLERSGLFKSHEIEQICDPDKIANENGVVAQVGHYLHRNRGISSFSKEMRESVDQFPSLYLETQKENRNQVSRKESSLEP